VGSETNRSRIVKRGSSQDKILQSRLLNIRLGVLGRNFAPFADMLLSHYETVLPYELVVNLDGGP
jgi:hypothetical protein